MNKHRQQLARLAMVIAAATAVSAPAFAQTETVPQGRSDAHAQHMQGGHRMGGQHGMMGEHGMGERGRGHDGIEHMRGLNLSEAQRDQIFNIRHASAPNARQAMKEAAAARAELRELSRADKFDEAKAKAAADREGAALAKVALQRAKTQHQIHAVLTPEQRQQIEQRRAARPAPAAAAAAAQ